MVLVTSVERALIDSISDLARELGVRIHGVLQKPYKAKELLALIESNGKLQNDRSTKPVAAGDASRGNQALLLLQPQVSLSSGKWLGCEAVVGQNSSQNSQVSKSKPPGRAIGSGNASHTDIEFVLKTLTHAVQSMKELEFNAGGPLSLSFPIPGQAMLHNDFARILIARLRQKNFPGSHLVLNITDSDHMQDSEQLHANIALLRQENVHFSLRYCSSEKPAIRNSAGYDEIKIDRSYIANLRNNKSDKDFVKLLLDRSARVCVPTVADGIADLETYQWLSAHGCDIGQGPLVCGLEDVGGLVKWHQSWAAGTRNRHHAPAKDGSSVPDLNFQKL